MKAMNPLAVFEQKYYEILNAEFLNDEQRLNAFSTIRFNIPTRIQMDIMNGEIDRPEWMSELSLRVDELQMKATLAKIDGILTTAQEGMEKEFKTLWDKIKGEKQE